MQRRIQDKYLFLASWLDTVGLALPNALHRWETAMGMAKVQPTTFLPFRFVQEEERRHTVMSHALGEKSTMATTLKRAECEAQC